MKFCTNCGAQLQDEAQFCTNCGAQQSAAQQAQPVVEAQPVYQQPVYQQPVQSAAQPTVPGKGLGIAGMILGIISLVLFCIFYISIPCSIIGAILGGVGLSKAKAVGMKNGMATAGFVCSCIALGVTILFIILAIAGLTELGFALNELDNSGYYY